VITLYQAIWAHRNSFLHGNSQRDAQQKLRQRILSTVEDIYNNPPILHRRFSRIKHIPLNERMKPSTTHLQRWLKHIEYQSVAEYMLSSLAHHKSLIEIIAMANKFNIR
jgi:hypothetical protein